MQVISYLAGTGTEDTVLNVTVTADPDYAWMLVEQYPAALTFKPSLNGSSLGQDFTVPVTESEQSVANLLAQVTREKDSSGVFETACLAG